MKNIFKYLPSIIYVCFIYLSQYMLIMHPSETKTLIVFIITILLGIINIAMAIIYGANKDKEVLLTNGVILKSSTVFIYVLIFGLTLSLTALFAIFVGPFSLVAIIPAFILDVLMLIVSSTYTITYLFLDYKESNNKNNIIHIILQLFFVLDVIDTIIITMIKEKDKRLKYLLLIIPLIVIPFIVFAIIII